MVLILKLFVKKINIIVSNDIHLRVLFGHMREHESPANFKTNLRVIKQN